MANPFLSMLGLGAQQQNQNGSKFSNLNEVLGLFNLVRGSPNPSETLNQMAQSNPSIANTLNYIKQNGGDMNKIAEQLAAQKGISLDLIKGLFR